MSSRLKKKSGLGLTGEIKGERLTPEIKLELMELIASLPWPVSKSCRVLKLKRGRYWRWKNRYDGTLSSLEDRAPIAQIRPHTLLPEERQDHPSGTRCFALDNPKERHRKLSFLMIDQDIGYFSPSTAYQVLKKEGLIKPWVPLKKPMRRQDIEVTGPNQVWYIDITYLKVNGRYWYLIYECFYHGEYQNAHEAHYGHRSLHSLL